MAVTTVQFDPRVDLPNGLTAAIAVTIKATPLFLRTSGTSTIFPQTVTFTDVTVATPFPLQSTDGTWAWSIGVLIGQRTVHMRTVAVTGTTANWVDLLDVDPYTFDVLDADPAWWVAITALIARLEALESRGTIYVPPITAVARVGAATIGYSTIAA